MPLKQKFFVFCMVGWMCITNLSSACAQDNKKVAVVIDDFGNNMEGTEMMMKLPVPITVAVMPFLPSSQKDAEVAHLLGRDVIVHLPMEPMRGKKSWLGPGAITTDLSDTEIRKRVLAAIADIPYAIGMNNHMGSKATADRRVMRVILSVCKEKGLFFLDSRTSTKSVIPEVAEELGVSIVRNDVFLDDVYTMEHIIKQVSRLKLHLKSHETCITIGHVGPSGPKTSAALLRAIPSFKGVQFVKISDLATPPFPSVVQDEK